MVRSSLKRGALVAAANWQVVALQFAADSAFKLLLLLPVVGGAFLVVLLVGGNAADLVGSDLRETLSAIAAALVAQPSALAAWLMAVVIVLVGGSALVLLVKGGTVDVLVRGERTAGPIEHAPLTLRGLSRAAAFSLESFAEGCVRLFARYLKLGLVLMVVYAASGAAYLAILYGGYRIGGHAPLLLGWTLVATFASSVLIAWITIVNLLYLLTQIVIATDDVGVREAMRTVAKFLKAGVRDVLTVFGIVLALVVLVTVVSIVATAALGLIAFVPIVWLAALPLQAAAWVLRGVVFQYLGLSALGAYLRLYRSTGLSAAEAPQPSIIPRTA